LTDHKDYLMRVVMRGAGFMLEKEYLSPQTLARSVDKILQTSSYQTQMDEFQDFILDVPYTELNHSAFWVEFVIRHHEVSETDDRVTAPPGLCRSRIRVRVQMI
jgi:hypothetical protein